MAAPTPLGIHQISSGEQYALVADLNRVGITADAALSLVKDHAEWTTGQAVAAMNQRVDKAVADTNAAVARVEADLRAEAETSHADLSQQIAEASSIRPAPTRVTLDDSRPVGTLLGYRVGAAGATFVSTVGTVDLEEGAYIFERTHDAWLWRPIEDGVTLAPDTTPPTPGTLTAQVTSSTITATIQGVSDNGLLHPTAPYSFSIDGGATWKVWQKAASYTFTGLASDTTYQLRHQVRDAAGNKASGPVLSAETATISYDDAVLASTPSVFLPLAESAQPVADFMAAAAPASADWPALGVTGRDGQPWAHFTTATDHVKFAAPAALSTPAAFTFEALLDHDTTSASGWITARTSTTASDVSWVLQMYGGNWRFVRYAGSGLAQVVVDLGPRPVEGAVRHIALTHDGTTLRAYIDGAEKKAAPLAGALTTKSAHVYALGSPITSPTAATESHRPMKLRGAVWYDRVLPASEIATHASAKPKGA